MSTHALLSLHQALKRCFQILEHNHKLWNSTLTDCTPFFYSLGNLAEQLLALQNVRLESTPLVRFENLRVRLRYKILVAVDTALGQILELMCTLKSVRDSISNQVSAVFQVYMEHSNVLDLAVCLQRSAISPSVSDMLEWLQDADRHYHQDSVYGYMKRKTLLQTLTPDDLTHLKTSPQRWESLAKSNGKDIVTDALLRVSLFRDPQ